VAGDTSVRARVLRDASERARTSARRALHRACTTHDTTPPILPFKVTVESFVTAAAPGAYYYYYYHHYYIRTTPGAGGGGGGGGVSDNWWGLRTSPRGGRSPDRKMEREGGRTEAGPKRKSVVAD